MAVKIYRPTLADLKDQAPLTLAEERVLAGCESLNGVTISNERPKKATPDISVRGSLIRYLLLGGCKAQRPSSMGVNISGAVITGGLDLENCDTRLQIDLTNCLFEDGVLMNGARVGLALFDGSKMPWFSANRSVFRSDLGFIGAEIDGTAGFDAAQIRGRLNCREAAFTGGLHGNALTVSADVFLSDGFHASSLVNLVGASIGGQLACSKGRFDEGLNGNALTVSADVFLRDGFHASGLVDLRGASIGGQLACRKGRFDEGLDGDALTVAADVFLSNGFHASGPVNLVRASIAGQLVCNDGRFDKGLIGDALTVSASVFLKDGFRASGLVNLVRADIGGNLSCFRGRFDQGLVMEHAKIAASFFWIGVRCGGSVNLMHADIGVLADELDSWEGVEKIHMNGFRYGAMETPDLDVTARLNWLLKNGGGEPLDETYWTQALGKKPPPRFQPQPYRQLAEAYENLGHNRRAARVREEAEKRRWANERWRDQSGLQGDWRDFFRGFRPMARLGFASLFSLLFGYGHAPSKAVLWAFGIIFFSSAFYCWVYNAGQMAPNSDIILTSAEWHRYADNKANKNPAQLWSDSSAGTDYESFSAIGYGFDLFVPLDALGQETAWAPSKARGTLRKIGFYLRWVVQVAGWVITAVGAATLTGLIGRK